MIKINTEPLNGVVVEIDENTSYVFTTIKSFGDFMNAIFLRAEINRQDQVNKMAQEEVVEAEYYEDFKEECDDTYTDGSTYNTRLYANDYDDGTVA